MDVRKYFILIQQSGNWIDKTSEISSIILNGHLYAVTFNNKSKQYNYQTTKLYVSDDPKPLDLSGSVVRIKSNDIKKWESAIVFGDYVRLFSDDDSQLEQKGDVEILPDLFEKLETKNIISYYFQIANLVSDSEPKSSYISAFYNEKLGYLQPESVAHAYITGNTEAHNNFTEIPIFPFGINPSQRKAVNASLNSQISLIQGPPGTGKTQTILNIISNLVMQGKRIAIVAGNNSAVANVYEKLNEEGFGFIVANLGNSKRQEAFFESDCLLSDISEWELTFDSRLKNTSEFQLTSGQIAQLLGDKNRLAIIKEEYARLNLEVMHFKKHFDISSIEMKKLSIFKHWNSSDLLSFMAEFAHYSQLPTFSLLVKIKWIYKYRIYKFSDLKELRNDTFKRIMVEYYQTKSEELLDEIKELEESLQNAEFDSLLEQLKAASSVLFKDYLAKTYQPLKDITFTKRSYKKDFESFLKRFPVVLSTTDSIINNKEKGTLFDYIIIDEASQVNLLTGFLTMACTKNIIVVGDLKQLPHITSKTLDRSIDENFNIPPAYSYFDKSLLASLVDIFPDSPNILLREHYRCHPKIIDFCNQKFYKGELITMTTGGEQPFKIVKTVKGNHARPPLKGSGYINVREIDVIENEVINEELEHLNVEDLGIISPYREQVNEVTKRISIQNLVTDTVHKFQGREKDTIILTTASNIITQFMDDPNLLNVAVSRAKNRFILVTSDNIVKKHGSNIGDLLRHIEYQSLDSCIVESEIISIFDCLYIEYSQRLNAFRDKVGNKSDFLSENLMAVLLDEIIEMDEYASFYYQRNYPLNLLVNEPNKLCSEEVRFACDTPSHIDFILYNKLDRQPVLAIEVDGYEFHVLNPKQRKRDITKNSILDKLSLPLLRLSTVESNEKERIVIELNKLVI